MRRINYAVLAVLGLAAFLLADVKTDYDHSVSFSRYHTFAWKPANSTDTGVADNSILRGRVEKAVEQQLISKGLREDSRKPDVYMDYGFRTKERIEHYPRWGWRRWDIPYVDRYIEGTLTLNMFDARTNHLVWRAYATNRGPSPLDVQTEKQVAKLVSGMFKHFPPPEKD